MNIGAIREHVTGIDPTETGCVHLAEGTIFMATASMSRPGFRQSVRSAVFVSSARCATMCGRQLNLAFEELGPLTLKNIARPVEAFALRLDPDAGATEAAEIGRDGSTACCNGTLVAQGTACANGGGSIGYCRCRLVDCGPRGAAGGPARKGGAADLSVAHAPALSLAVLPFATSSGNPEQEYLADGIAEDLATELSHIRGFSGHRAPVCFLL